MPPSDPPSLVSRIVFWLLGSLLFLSIAWLPNYLLTKFYTGGQVHATVVALVVVIFALIWGSTFLMPQGSGTESAE